MDSKKLVYSGPPAAFTVRSRFAARGRARPIGGRRRGRRESGGRFAA